MNKNQFLLYYIIFFIKNKNIFIKNYKNNNVNIVVLKQKFFKKFTPYNLPRYLFFIILTIIFSFRVFLNFFFLPFKFSDFTNKSQNLGKIIQKSFLRKSITSFQINIFLKKNKKFFCFLFLNKFVVGFLEFFFKRKVFFLLKKGSNKLLLKQVSFRKFSFKYFKKNLKIGKQVLGILYYMFLLKDSSLFLNFFRKSIEAINIKLHKKLFLGLKKLIKDVYYPVFNYLGVLGFFFNIKGKIGVSGSAKKKRYFFFYGKHSITKRILKIDYKHVPV